MKSQKKICLVVAINNDSLIGIKEYGQYSIPWPILKNDMIHFRKITTTTKFDNQFNAIIVGYNTWLSLPKIYKNNKKRINIIISRSANTDKINGSEKYVNTFHQALQYAIQLENVDKIFVIGGSAIYDLALSNPLLETIYITHVNDSYPSDNDVEKYIYFPLSQKHIDYLIEQKALHLEYQTNHYDINKNISYCINTYHVFNLSDYYNKLEKNQRIVPYKPNNLPKKCISGEYQYLNLVKKIMKEGVFKKTRNAITKSIFGFQMQFNLQDGYPISTLKKSYPKAIFEELMWMIRGETNVKILQKKNVHIWDKNSSKEFLEKYSLPYEEGDIGPGYGFQFRHFGAKYINCSTDYTGMGYDQLQNCINLIKNDPFSRRIVINLWNCNDIDKMALPPCHIIYNFGVDLYDKPNQTDKKGKLNCHLLQRSWDVLLGWNTTTAALLTYLLAHHCDLDAGILVHSITDAHIYKDHIDSGAVDKLLMRIPRKFPTIHFLNKREKIEDYIFEDFVIENYYPAPNIEADMIA